MGNHIVQPDLHTGFTRLDELHKPLSGRKIVPLCIIDTCHIVRLCLPTEVLDETRAVSAFV